MASEPTKTTFAPSVVVDGRVVYPPGHVWLLAFAIGGCKWAEDALLEMDAVSAGSVVGKGGGDRESN